MKHEKTCEHSWDDLYLFSTVDGEKFIQQRCQFCKVSRYVPASKPIDKNNQNGSKTEVTHNET